MKKPLLLIAVAATIAILLLGVLIALIFFVIMPNINKPVSNQVLISATPIQNTQVAVATETPTPSISAHVLACDILTQDIAEQVLKVKVSKSPNTTDFQCTYATADASSGNINVVSIMIIKTSPAEAKAEFDIAKTSTYGSDIDNVTGLNADEAYWANKQYQLSILKGDKWIIFTAISSNYTDIKAISIDTAKLSLART